MLSLLLAVTSLFAILLSFSFSLHPNARHFSFPFLWKTVVTVDAAPSDTSSASMTSFQPDAPELPLASVSSSSPDHLRQMMLKHSLGHHFFAILATAILFLTQTAIRWSFLPRLRYSPARSTAVRQVHSLFGRTTRIQMTSQGRHQTSPCLIGFFQFFSNSGAKLINSGVAQRVVFSSSGEFLFLSFQQQVCQLCKMYILAFLVEHLCVLKCLNVRLTCLNLCGSEVVRTSGFIGVITRGHSIFWLALTCSDREQLRF